MSIKVQAWAVVNSQQRCLADTLGQGQHRFDCQYSSILPPFEKKVRSMKALENISVLRSKLVVIIIWCRPFQRRDDDDVPDAFKSTIAKWKVSSRASIFISDLYG